MSTTNPSVVTDRDELVTIYHELLVPNFPEDELESLEVFLADAARDGSLALSLRDADGHDVAVSIGHHDAGSNVLLLVYLAVRPGIRGGGLGQSLLAKSLALWTERFSPSYVVGEVERLGDRDEVVEAYGDPEARLRFYRRFGARKALAPFFQPALGDHRVPMHLMLLYIAGDMRVGDEVDGHQQVLAAPLRLFVETYIREVEEDGWEDDESRALLSALDSETVDTVSL